MFRKAIVGFLAVMAAFTINAEQITQFAFIKNPDVNLRADASTSSQVVGKAECGGLYVVNEIRGDWTQVQICDGIDCEYLWISSQFVEILTDRGADESFMDSSFSFEDGDTYGLLSFERIGNDEWGNPKYNYHCLVKNNQMIRDGGNGVIVNECRPVISIMGILCQPEDWCDVVGGAVYDPDKKLLWYAGFLWNEE